MPARKLLNLVLHWMMEHTDGEVWAEKFRPIFFPTPEENPERAGVSKAKLAPAVAGQQGSLNITPKAEPVKVTDLSKFLGRAGSTGKVDPNKATLAAKARAKAPIRITPDENGDLSIDEP